MRVGKAHNRKAQEKQAWLALLLRQPSMHNAKSHYYPKMTNFTTKYRNVKKERGISTAFNFLGFNAYALKIRD